MLVLELNKSWVRLKQAVIIGAINCSYAADSCIHNEKNETDKQQKEVNLELFFPNHIKKSFQEVQNMANMCNYDVTISSL